MNECTVKNVPFFSSLSKESPKRSNALAFDISLFVDNEFQLLRQKRDHNLEKEIHRAYQSGSQLGIEMDNATIGKNYAENFFNFISSRVLIDRTRSLEIGCGNGYFLSLLRKSGSIAIGIEPGSKNINNEGENEADIIRGFFPQDLPNDYKKSDLIIAHAVLEHIVDPVDVLVDIKNSLMPGGHIFVAVPDCGPYLEIGDPSILLHEHYSYFTEHSLRRVLELAGFNQIEIVNASYGNLLYASGVNANETASAIKVVGNPRAEKTYISKVNNVRNGMMRLASEKSIQLGIYCPARAISVLPPWGNYRLFDDDLSIYHHFYPVWESWVESRNDLYTNPVDELWIMSLSFGEKLKLELQERFPNTVIYTLSEKTGSFLPSNSGDTI